MSEIIKTKLVGVSQDNYDGPSRQEIIAKCVRTDEILILKREPSNSHDHNAIAAFIAPDNDPWDEGEYQVGYLKSELASRLAPIIDSGGRVTCVVLNLTGGSEGEELGVNVALGVFSPEEVIEHERQKKLVEPNNTPSLNVKKQVIEEIKPTHKNTAKQKKINYKIKAWPAIIGLSCLLSSIIAFSLVSEDQTIIIMAFIFLVPAIILLLPWERWIFVQIKKMFARKQ